ncbi:unnamed protein product [Owenia fusiformis]|uniref:Uncharacterized protein n=1 Tax=Owenia fusiformis TaxID=6347 RepID=A0A8S4NU33_OWEFU|nr:unnamed protein product [Owenia fusiformis]
MIKALKCSQCIWLSWILHEVLSEFEDSTEDLMETGYHFLPALYGQPPWTSIKMARYKIYSKKKGKPMRFMALPPTEMNLILHVLQAHLQVMLWKDVESYNLIDVM